MSAWILQTSDVLPGPPAESLSLAWSPDGLTLATLVPNCCILIWDTNDGAITRLLDADSEPVRGLAFGEGGHCVASMLENGSVAIWDCQSDRPCSILEQADFQDPIVSWSPDGRVLVTGTASKLCFWNVYVGGPVTERPTSNVQCLAWSRDSTSLAVAGAKSHISIFNRDGKVTGKRQIPLLNIKSITWIPGLNQTVVLGTDKGRLLMLSVATGHLTSIDPGHKAPVSALSASFDGRLLASKAADGEIVLWRLEAEKIARVEVFKESASPGLSQLSLAFHPSRHLFASADAVSGRVVVREFERSEPQPFDGENSATAKRTPDTEKLKVFVSYARKDISVCRELVGHLRVALTGSEVFFDDDIRASQEWNSVLMSELNSAHLVLMLLSQDFFSSSYISETEAKMALERYERGACEIVCVLVRDVAFEDTAFNRFNIIPKSADGQLRPVNTWPNRDDALTAVARAVRDASKDRFKK